MVHTLLLSQRFSYSTFTFLEAFTSFEAQTMAAYGH